MVIAMARINIDVPRTEATEKKYLGKTLIFCEGSTEHNYLKYFADILNENQNKFTDVKIELENAEGNAKTVLNHANNYFEKDENKNKYSSYDVYLVFDCDDPSNIQEVIIQMMESENGYILLLTNLLFELWLLMHFEEVSAPIKKINIYNKLADHLGLEEYKSRDKTSLGRIRQILGDGINVSSAIQNAMRLEDEMKSKDYTVNENIELMNPYTTMHKIMIPIADELKRFQND